MARWHSCQECSGSGYIECERCLGTGANIDTDRICRDCVGDGAFDCVACEGNGGYFEESDEED